MTAQTESSGVEMIFNGSMKEVVVMTVRCCVVKQIVFVSIYSPLPV